MPLGDPAALALAQLRAHLEQPVARWRRALRLQLGEEVGREDARARPQLEHVAAGPVQHLADLHREAAREHGRDLGRGDEVALAADLARPRGVVAEPGRIESELHEARERDPLALLRDRRWRCARRARESGRPLRERGAAAGIRPGKTSAMAAPSGNVRGFRYTFASVAARRAAGRFAGDYSTMGQPAVLVTGGARRVGAAIVRAVHAAGANVIVHCHRSCDEAGRLLAAAGGRSAPAPPPSSRAISSTPNAFSASSRQAAARFGRLDGLVNNASSFHATPLGASTPRRGRTWSAPTCARRSSSRRPPRRTCAPRAARS